MPEAARHRLPPEGRIRAVIDRVEPAVDGGRFPVKRVLGEHVSVSATCFTDGHDVIACRLRWQHERETDWHEASGTTK